MKKKSAWQMTLSEYKACPLEQLVSGAARFIELSPEMKKRAKAKYIEDTNDICGADKLSGEYALDEYFFSTTTGKVTGDDFLGHRKEVELALSEGKPVPFAVLADYPDLRKINTQPAEVIPNQI